MSTKHINRMSNLVVIVALAVNWLPVTSATAIPASGTQAAQMLLVESLLNYDGTLNTTTTASGTLDLRGWNVTLDSARGPILTRAAAATPNTNPWSALANNGLEFMVTALAVSGSDLYVGGVFTQTADNAVTNLNHIAKYSDGAWSALANNGLDAEVYALAVSGNDLYVGGGFTQTADGTVKNLNHIAKYSGGTWSALSNNGLSDAVVYALAVSGNDLYVGGSFWQTADGTVKNLNDIAKYSNGTWSALANDGLNSNVYALAVSGSDLYVGGDFTQSFDGTMTNLNKIARYSSGGTWSALSNNGLLGYHGVYALAVSGSDLYVGGDFTQTADGTVKNLNNIAKYSGGVWSAFAHNGLGNYVQALAVSGSDLYVGGWFTQSADGTVNNLHAIAKYSSGAWSALPNNGLSNDVYALAVSESALYVGGEFTGSGDWTVTNLRKIAKLGLSTAPDHSCYLPMVSK